MDMVFAVALDAPSLASRGNDGIIIARAGAPAANGDFIRGAAAAPNFNRIVSVVKIIAGKCIATFEKDIWVGFPQALGNQLKIIDIAGSGVRTGIRPATIGRVRPAIGKIVVNRLCRAIVPEETTEE